MFAFAVFILISFTTLPAATVDLSSCNWAVNAATVHIAAVVDAVAAMSSLYD